MNEWQVFVRVAFARHSLHTAWRLIMCDCCNTQTRSGHALDGGDGDIPTSSPYALVPFQSSLSLVIDAARSLARPVDSPPLFEQFDQTAAAIVGRRIALNIHAQEDAPLHPLSMVDGFAFRFSPSLGRSFALDVRGASVPGSQTIDKTTQIINNEQTVPAHYITTGGALLPCYDSVLPVECARFIDGVWRVSVGEQLRAGANVRQPGSDLTKGDLLAAAGDVLDCTTIGLLASVGICSIPLYARPLVSVLSSGNELHEPGDQTDKPPAATYDSNRFILMSAVVECGCSPVDCGRVGDDLSAIERRLSEAAARATVVISSGGVSMGKHDHVKQALINIGATILFGRVNLKPGKPTTCAVLDRDGRRTLFFALPGNPVSSLVAFRLLVEPALRILQGDDRVSLTCALRELPVTLANAVSLDQERPEFHRVSLHQETTSGRFLAASTGSQQSSRLLSCRSASALIALPSRADSGTARLEAGQQVKAIIINNLWQAAANQSNTNTHAEENKHTTTSAAPSVLPPSASVSSPAAVSSPSFLVGCLIISDRVSGGSSVDRAGPLVRDIVERGSGWGNARPALAQLIYCPDEIEDIQAHIKRLSDPASPDHCALIITSGGTGFGPRDVTPEAIEPLLRKRAPGLVQLMMKISLEATVLGSLSRPVAGVVGSSLVLTLPGSPKAVQEVLPGLSQVIAHAVRLIKDNSDPHPVRTN